MGEARVTHLQIGDLNRLASVERNLEEMNLAFRPMLVENPAAVGRKRSSRVNIATGELTQVGSIAVNDPKVHVAAFEEMERDVAPVGRGCATFGQRPRSAD